MCFQGLYVEIFNVLCWSKWKRRRLGITIKYKKIHEELKRVEICFDNNGDFCASKVESERKMQEPVSYYETMYESNESEVQKEKFTWCIVGNGKIITH